MSTELTTQERITPMSLLQLALQKESNVDVIAKIKAMQDEEREYISRIAYSEAFFEFKQNAPVILKTAEILVKGETRGMYAPLDEICDKLIPALIKVGITHRWKTHTEDNGRTTVTCYLRHRQGYEEEGSSMTAAPDTSGSKNSIQADGSTMSYLQRYTLVTSCGIAIKGKDNDGNGDSEVAGQKMDDDRLSDLKASIEGAGDLKQRATLLGTANTEALELGDRDALIALFVTALACAPTKEVLSGDWRWMCAQVDEHAPAKRKEFEKSILTRERDIRRGKVK